MQTVIPGYGPASRRRIVAASILAPAIGMFVASLFNPLAITKTSLDSFWVMYLGNLMLAYPLFLLLGLPFILKSEKKGARSFSHYLRGGFIPGIILFLLLAALMLLPVMMIGDLVTLPLLLIPVVPLVASVLISMACWTILFKFQSNGE